MAFVRESHKFEVSHLEARVVTRSLPEKRKGRGKTAHMKLNGCPVRGSRKFVSLRDLNRRVDIYIYVLFRIGNQLT